MKVRGGRDGISKELERDPYEQCKISLPIVTYPATENIEYAYQMPEGCHHKTPLVVPNRDDVASLVGQRLRIQDNSPSYTGDAAVFNPILPKPPTSTPSTPT